MLLLPVEAGLGSDATSHGHGIDLVWSGLVCLGLAQVRSCLALSGFGPRLGDDPGADPEGLQGAGGGAEALTALCGCCGAAAAGRHAASTLVH